MPESGRAGCVPGHRGTGFDADPWPRDRAGQVFGRFGHMGPSRLRVARSSICSSLCINTHNVTVHATNSSDRPCADAGRGAESTADPIRVGPIVEFTERGCRARRPRGEAELSCGAPRPEQEYRLRIPLRREQDETGMVADPVQPPELRLRRPPDPARPSRLSRTRPPPAARRRSPPPAVAPRGPRPARHRRQRRAGAPASPGAGTSRAPSRRRHRPR